MARTTRLAVFVVAMLASLALTTAARAARPAPPPARETAVLAGGCFWGMEELLRKIPGVLDTEVGYASAKNSKERPAEAVRVVFDPRQVSYEALLEGWYFRMHDPTTVNQQGNDRGPRYRSAIFATTAKQRRTALAVRARVDASGKWPRPVVTQVSEIDRFVRAQDSHQDYLQRSPKGYTCHYLRE